MFICPVCSSKFSRSGGTYRDGTAHVVRRRCLSCWSLYSPAGDFYHQPPLPCWAVETDKIPTVSLSCAATVDEIIRSEV